MSQSHGIWSDGGTDSIYFNYDRYLTLSYLLYTSAAEYLIIYRELDEAGVTEEGGVAYEGVAHDADACK